MVTKRWLFGKDRQEALTKARRSFGENFYLLSVRKATRNLWYGTVENGVELHIGIPSEYYS